MEITPNGSDQFKDNFVDGMMKDWVLNLRKAVEKDFNANTLKTAFQQEFQEHDPMQDFSPTKTEMHTIQIKKIGGGVLPLPVGVDEEWWVTREMAANLQSF